MEHELIEDVKAYVIGAGRFRTSVIQRKFRIGFLVAARIKDNLVESGFIGSEFDISLNGYPLLCEHDYDPLVLGYFCMKCGQEVKQVTNQ